MQTKGTKKAFLTGKIVILSANHLLLVRFRDLVEDVIYYTICHFGDRACEFLVDLKSPNL